MPVISRHHAALYALALLAVVVLGARQLTRTPSPAPPARAPAPRVAVERDAGAPAVVHVAGAVRRGGVYRLRAGARVRDAIARAGGARAGADLDAINLAAKVADGQQVVVPRRGAAIAAAAADGDDAAAAGLAPGARVNLNSATAEQLDALDGVGPATARKILEWRRAHGGFRSVDDLAQVPGIGPKRMAALRERVQA